MSLIGYGALLRVNGKFVNKNSGLFMNSDGIIEKAYDVETGEEYDIKGNFYVYAGDEHFMLTFYKDQFIVIRDGEIIYKLLEMPFVGLYTKVNGIDISVEMICKNAKTTHFGEIDSYMLSYYTKLHGYKKGTNLYYRYIKRHKRNCYKYYINQYIATWTYNNNHYEVIFGYGIDNNEEVYNSVKTDYEYSQEAIKLIDSWFNSSDRGKNNADKLETV